MTSLYRIYFFLVAAPIIAIATVITSLTVVIGCTLGDGNFWGYHPGKLWSRLILKVLGIKVKVSGRENLEEGQSYVFVSNHQGVFDIFLIYGYLGRNFKWMMKHQLRKVPFVGIACEKAHHIFVDKRGAKRIKETYDKARATLKGGMSLVVFPEGARTFSGHMGDFRRGAYLLADELQLPIVPLTINGSFDVMPRFRKIPEQHPISLTIHAPMHPESQGAVNVNMMMRDSYETIMDGLVKKYQGYEENPDQ